MLVGIVRYLDVDPDGRLLVTDTQGGEVFLFDREGNHLKTLDPEPCHPGFNWRPVRAYFTPQGRIFMTNGGPWGFRFDAEGNCIGGMPRDFLPPSHLDFDRDERGFGHYRSARGHHVKELSFDGATVARFGAGTRQRHFINRIRNGGLVATGGRVFVALVPSPYIFAFTQEGELIGKIGWKPEEYRKIPPEEDTDHSNTAADILAANRQLREGRSTTTRLSHLESNHLMLMYQNLYEERESARRYGFYIVRADGEPVTRGVFHMERPFFFAKGGYAYRRGERELEDGELENPYLEVYRFKQE